MAVSRNPHVFMRGKQANTHKYDSKLHEYIESDEIRKAINCQSRQINSENATDYIRKGTLLDKKTDNKTVCNHRAGDIVYVCETENGDLNRTFKVKVLATIPQNILDVFLTRNDVEKLRKPKVSFTERRKFITANGSKNDNNDFLNNSNAKRDISQSDDNSRGGVIKSFNIQKMKHVSSFPRKMVSKNKLEYTSCIFKPSASRTKNVFNFKVPVSPRSVFNSRRSISCQTVKNDTESSSSINDSDIIEIIPSKDIKIKIKDFSHRMPGEGDVKRVEIDDNLSKPTGNLFRMER